MRKFTVTLLTVSFVLSVSFFAYAVHQDVAIPYELIFGHESTMPLANAGDLRHHITGHMPYKKHFKLWPGKKEFYEGTEPHGSLLTIYVNDMATKSIKKKKKKMGNNSIIIKENYAPDKKLIAVTVMYKIKGYNPEGGDWFWAKYDANFKILSEGKVDGCLSCHSTAKGNDYIFQKRQ
jgi:hypothetical protein